MKALSHSQASSLDVTQTSYTNFNSGGSEGGGVVVLTVPLFFYFFYFCCFLPHSCAISCNTLFLSAPPQPCSLRRSSSVVISSVSVRLLYRELFGFFFVWLVFFPGHCSRSSDVALRVRWRLGVRLEMILNLANQTSTNSDS